MAIYAAAGSASARVRLLRLERLKGIRQMVWCVLSGGEVGVVLAG